MFGGDKRRAKPARTIRPQVGEEAVPVAPAAVEGYIHIDAARSEITIAREHRENARIRSFIDSLQRSRSTRHYNYVFKPLREISALKNSTMAARANAADNSFQIDQAKKIIQVAADRRSSDVYIITDGSSCEIKLRVDGAVVPSGIAYTSDEAIAIIRVIYETISSVHDAHLILGEPQSSQISKRSYLPEGVDSVRVESGPNAKGHDMCLRLLYESSGVPEEAQTTEEMLSWLGYFSEQTEKISALLRQPSGIVVISGPTGSGKSTTLKYGLQGLARARPDLMIRTVEDPVEYPMDNVIQTAVTNAKTDEERRRGFGRFLTSTLRKAPDVIMIGEIRDGPTARIAIDAAMTGHLVFTTLHTSNAWQVISRMGDKLREGQMENVFSFLGDPQIMIGLVYQRLVRRVCTTCSRPIGEKGWESLPPFVRRALADAGVTRQVLIQSDARQPHDGGCQQCGGRGTRGRTVIAEVVLPTDEQMERVRAGDVESARQMWMRENPGDAVSANALRRVLEGVISPVDALYAARAFSAPFASPLAPAEPLRTIG